MIQELIMLIMLLAAVDIWIWLDVNTPPFNRPSIIMEDLK